MSERFYKAVARRIHDVRVASGLTQEEVAARASLNPYHVSRIENGAENLSLQTLGRFALAMGVPVARFLEDVEVGAEVLERRPRLNARNPALRGAASDREADPG